MARSKRSKTKPRKSVKRTTRHFQLRVDNPQDQHVGQVLDYAKSQRREVTMIRDAITLFWALEQGDLNALFEKFPQYKAQFTPPTSATGGSGGGQLDEIKSILEMLAAQQKTDQYVMKSITPTTPAPVAEVKQAAPVSADTIADNFLNAFL